MRTRRYGIFGCALLTWLGTACVAAPESAPPSAALSPAGETFAFAQGGRQVTVRYFQPTGSGPNLPVVFVCHGLQRNGADYLRDWMPLAQAHHFLVIVPEFSTAEFPGAAGYILGNTIDAAGKPRPRAEWSFSMIEPIFDAVRQRTGNQRERYALYGHSAGAQFVQRFLYFVPDARLDRAVAANAGWYMLPDLAVSFPYGLGGTPVTAADLDHALGRSFTVLLGTADTDPQSHSLRHTPEADAQGPHRLARGRGFFQAAQSAAATRGCPLAWTLATAPEVGHSDPGMAPFAVPLLLAP